MIIIFTNFFFRFLKYSYFETIEKTAEEIERSVEK